MRLFEEVGDLHFGLLAGGQSRDEIRRAYPYLEAADIDEALRYAEFRRAPTPSWLHAMPLDTARDDRRQCPKMDTRHA